MSKRRAIVISTNNFRNMCIDSKGTGNFLLPDDQGMYKAKERYPNGDMNKGL